VKQAKQQEKQQPVAHPSSWRAAFQSQAMRSSFALTLTQPMLENLCAIADGVESDRSLYFQCCGAARPDNFLATSKALEKRGLIHDHPRRHDMSDFRENYDQGISHIWQLTPAGEALVVLLKVTGIFVEADAAIALRAKQKVRQ